MEETENVTVWGWNVAILVNVSTENVTMEPRCWAGFASRAGAQQWFQNLLVRNYMRFQLIVSIIHTLLWITNWWLISQTLIRFCLAPWFLNWFSTLKHLSSLEIQEALAILSPHSMWQHVPSHWTYICYSARFPSLLLHWVKHLLSLCEHLD